ncbi:hypothetical protein D3C73_776910 [compost metagenome]
MHTNSGQAFRIITVIVRNFCSENAHLAISINKASFPIHIHTSKAVYKVISRIINKTCDFFTLCIQIPIFPIFLGFKNALMRPINRLINRRKDHTTPSNDPGRSIFPDIIRLSLHDEPAISILYNNRVIIGNRCKLNTFIIDKTKFTNGTISHTYNSHTIYKTMSHIIFERDDYRTLTIDITPFTLLFYSC